MIHLLTALAELIFPKYKVKRYAVGKDLVWTVTKRRYLFFYYPLTTDKFVSRDNWVRCPIVSKERLIFVTEEEAESELDRLNFGYPEIATDEYHNGKLIRTTYADGSEYYYD